MFWLLSKTLYLEDKRAKMENGSQIRLEQNNLASAIDYIWGVAIMFACFIAVQRTLVWMVGDFCLHHMKHLPIFAIGNHFIYKYEALYFYSYSVVCDDESIGADSRPYAVEIFYSFDDENYTMMRNCWLQDNKPVMVGMMAACPDGNGFKATFEEFTIKHLPDARRLEWLKNNK